MSDKKYGLNNYREPAMTHEEKAHSIVSEWHIRHYEEPLKDAMYIEGAMYQALIDNFAEALASAEKKGRESKIPSSTCYLRGWNEAIEAAAGILRSRCPDDDGECRCTFVKLSEEINKLKRG